MALRSEFGFTNTAEQSSTVTPTNLKLVDTYALKADEPTQVTLDNKTCPLDQGEVVNFMCTDLKKVSTNVDIQHPAEVTTAVQYVIRLDEVLTTTSDTDSEYRVDEPVVAYLTVRHQKSGNITNALIGQVVTRLIGACRREDGSWRFDDLMRSALKPSVN